MNKITTPMAILISGILISLVLAFKSFPRYEVRYAYDGIFFKTDTLTGTTCFFGENIDINAYVQDIAGYADNTSDEYYPPTCKQIYR